MTNPGATALGAEHTAASAKEPVLSIDNLNVGFESTSVLQGPTVRVGFGAVR